MVDKSTMYYKIGYSFNPEKRESVLLSEKPTLLLLSKKHIGNDLSARLEEQRLHIKYSDFRVRGEWFALGIFELYELLNYMQKDKIDIVENDLKKNIDNSIVKAQNDIKPNQPKAKKMSAYKIQQLKLKRKNLNRSINRWQQKPDLNRHKIDKHLEEIKIINEILKSKKNG